MATKIFKYKRNPNTAYIPGSVYDGSTGSKGKTGNRKNGLYFCDYDFTDSYYKDSLMERLNANLTLSSTSNAALNDVEYQINDVILTKNNKVYTLVEGSGENKFDIRYIGELKNNVSDNNAGRIRDLNIAKLTVDAKFANATASDRSMERITDTCTERADALLRLRFRIRTQNFDDYSKYKLGIHIFLKNSKSISGKGSSNFLSTASEETMNITSFYKRIDIDNIQVSSSTTTVDVDFTDRFMNKNHLFNNDIRYNIFHIAQDGSTYVFGRMVDTFDDNEVALDENNTLPLLTKNADSSTLNLINSLDELVNVSNFDNSTNMNYRSGDSAYFSSRGYNEAASEMRDFIENIDDNLYMISITDLTTYKTTYMFPDVTI